MRIGMDVTVHVAGIEPLIVRYTDDVDAEGTMVETYVTPIVDAACGDFLSLNRNPIDLGDGTIIIDPSRIVALEYVAFDWSDD